MLTPVDITNRVFKGGIGYDKKDVEAFMLELSTDYRELYSTNVELNDKIATLNESLQHYRSIEDSMQKALTLSEKTAEETVDAANSRARQINTEAEIKAETLLADAKAELQETKDDIYRLQQQYELFKTQFTKMLDAHKKLMDGEMIDIDLGPDFEPSNPGYGNFSGGTLGNEGGLGGLGAGTYTGSNDSGRERTNQEPAFDRGSLNMDPFADAANGGGRFSRQTGGVYTGAKKKSKSTTADNSGLNMKEGTAKSNKAKPNTAAVTPVTETSNSVASQTKPESTVQSTTDAQQPINQTSQEPQKQATQTVSREDVIAAIKAAAEAAEYENYIESDEKSEDAYSGEVESKINESNMLDSEDNYSTGFDFVVEETAEEEIPTILSDINLNSFNHSSDEDVLTGDIEDKINQSNLIGNDDDNDEGFSFM